MLEVCTRISAERLTDTLWQDPSTAKTCLQAHCSYFDPDNDGIVWPANTFRGFRNIGFNIVLAALAVVVIHGTFSYFTQTSW